MWLQHCLQGTWEGVSVISGGCMLGNCNSQWFWGYCYCMLSGMGFRALHSKGHLQCFLLESKSGFHCWCRHRMLLSQICRIKRFAAFLKYFYWHYCNRGGEAVLMKTFKQPKLPLADGSNAVTVLFRYTCESDLFILDHVAEDTT